MEEIGILEIGEDICDVQVIVGEDLCVWRRAQLGEGGAVKNVGKGQWDVQITMFAGQWVKV